MTAPHPIGTPPDADPGAPSANTPRVEAEPDAVAAAVAAFLAGCPIIGPGPTLSTLPSGRYAVQVFGDAADPRMAVYEPGLLDPKAWRLTPGRWYVRSLLAARDRGVVLTIDLDGWTLPVEDSAALYALAARFRPSSPAAERVWQKRLRQITHHGYTPEHDATHPPGQFAAAAVALAEWATVWREGTDPHLCYSEVHSGWPWDRASWDRATSTLDETLTNAAALIVAELDQLLASTADSDGTNPVRVDG